MREIKKVPQIKMQKQKFDSKYYPGLTAYMKQFHSFLELSFFGAH